MMGCSPSSPQTLIQGKAGEERVGKIKALVLSLGVSSTKRISPTSMSAAYPQESRLALFVVDPFL